MGAESALAVGITFHAIETIVGVSFGLAGTLKLIGLRFPLVPRVAAAAAGVISCVAAGASSACSRTSRDASPTLRLDQPRPTTIRACP